MKQISTVLVANQKLLESLSVTEIMAAIKSKGFSHFEPDSNFVTQGCLLENGNIESLPSSPLSILVTTTTTKQQRCEKYKVLGHLNDYVYTIFTFKAPHKLCQDDQSLPSIVGTVSTEEESSPSILEMSTK